MTRLLGRGRGVRLVRRVAGVRLVPVAAALAAATALTPAAAAGQARVLGVGWTAELDSAGGVVVVESRYRLAPDTAAEVPLLLVRFGTPRLADLTARVDGREVAPEAVEAPERVRRARLRLPAARGDTVELVLAYEVRGVEPLGTSFDLALPVAVVDWPPSAAREQFFSALLRLPAAYTLVDVFPTVPFERRAAAGADRVEYAFTLPVLPSLVRVRGRVGPSPLFTFGRWVDLGVGALLIVLGIVAWRELRR